MIVTLSVNRVRRGEEIWETFSVSPENSIISKDYRAIHLELWKLRIENSLGNILKLKKLMFFDFKTIYIYEFKNIKVELSKQFQIEYFPVLGKKTCDVCLHECEISSVKYCHLKGNALKKHSYYKCFYWVERSLNPRQEKNVHQSRGSATNRKIYK